MMGFGSLNASATSNNVDLELIIEPSLQIIIPSSGIQLDLNPDSTGTVFDAQDYTVKVATNNPTGYTLNLTANSTDLKRVSEDTDTTNENTNDSNDQIENESIIIPTLAELAGGYTEDNFTTNHWGYKLTKSSNTPTNDTYQPFKTNLNLGGTTTPTTNDETTITFGAKVDVTRPAGLYELAINFIAVANTVITSTYIQDFTLESCRTQASLADAIVTDERDGKTYTVRYINGNCWMTQNLAFNLTTGMTLSPETTNVSTEVIMGTVDDLISGNNRTGASIHIPTSAELEITKLTMEENGYYYNYCAATAGEICETTADEATMSVCPAGWTLPTRAQFLTLTDGKGGVYTFTYAKEFPVTAAGYYYSGVNGRENSGHWWSSTSSNPANISNRYKLEGRSTGLMTHTSGHDRADGNSIRCVRKN